MGLSAEAMVNDLREGGCDRPVPPKRWSRILREGGSRRSDVRILREGGWKKGGRLENQAPSPI
jgi:hypothetical protein